MSDLSNFSDREVRLVQIGLAAILIVGIAWLVVTLNPWESTPTAFAPAPPGALIRFGKGTIEQLSSSPDGRTIAVRTSIGLFVYRADDLHPLWQETEQVIYQVGFSPDGRTLWGMTAQGLVGWDATIGAQRLLLDRIWRETGGSLWLEGPHTWAVAWEYGLPQTLAAPAPCGYQNDLLPEPVTLMCIDFIDLETGLLIEQLPTVVQLRSDLDPQLLPGQPVALYLSHILATGEFIVAIQDRLWFWDPERELLTGAVPLPGFPTTRPAFSLDGTEALLSIAPGVYAFDRAQSSLSSLEFDSGPVLSLAYTVDGRRILIGTADGELVEIGRATHWVIERHQLGAAILDIAAGQDQDTILLDDGRGSLLRWKVSSGLTEGSIDGFLAPASLVAWSPLADQLAIASRPSTLGRDDPRQMSIWNLEGGQTGQRIFGERIIDIAWSPQGETIAVGTWSRGGSIQWLDAETLVVQHEYILDGEGLCGLGWSTDGRLAVATAELSVLVFDPVLFSPALELVARELWVPPGAACRGVSWSPDGGLVALEIANGSPIFWESIEGTPVDSLNPDPLDSQAFTAVIGWDAEGQPLVAGYDHPIGVRDLEQHVSGQAQPMVLWVELQENRLEIELPDVPMDMAFSPDGRMLAVAYQEMVEVIELTTDHDVNRMALPGHRDQVNGLAWSWQGEYLASYSLDGSVIIWQVDF